MPEFFLHQSTSFDCSHEISDNMGEGVPHIHNWYEILFVFSGRGTLIVEGTEYPLVPYGLYVMSVGEAHYFKLSPSPFSGENQVMYDRARIHFSAETIHSFDPGRELLAPFTARPSGHMNFFAQNDAGALISQLFSQIEACGPSQDMLIRSYIVAILAQINMQFISRPHELHNDLPSRVLNYINHHLAEELSLDSICQRFYISQSQMSRLIKKATNLTVWQYVLLKRLSMAQTLMESGMSATLAAGASGFRDYSTFYKAYRNRFRAAPSHADRRAR